MTARINRLLLAVLACAVFGLAAAQTGVTLPGSTEKPSSGSLCAGPPAKYRYQWAYVMNAPTPANVAALEKIIMDWTTACSTPSTGALLRSGQSASLAKGPADYGMRTPPAATSVLADFGGYLDFNSLDDLKACFATGIKEGMIAKARTYAKTSYRTVYSLSGLQGNPTGGCRSATSNAPATVRFQTFYMLKDKSPAGIKLVAELYFKALVRNWIRTASGPDAVEDSDLEDMFGKGVKRTADFGGFIDFKSVAEMTAQFMDPKSAADTTRLRALPSSSVRLVIKL